MTDRRELARAHWRDLLPTAFLLTGDQAAARRLVVRTLARPARPTRGRPATPEQAHRAAVAALVRTHRRWRLGAGAGQIAGQLPAPWWADPADLAAAQELARRLDDLDRDRRTAAVLRWAEGWTPDDVTALAPGVDLDDLARWLGPGLERRLDTLAGLCTTTDLDDDTVVDDVQRTAQRRVRRAVVGVAVVAALVGVGAWLPTVAPEPTRASPTSGAPSRSTEPVPPRGIYALPPRGALAGAADLLAQVQDRLTEDGLAGDRYQLLYGDDVDGVRALLAAAPDGAGGDAAWLTGPAGTDPADLQVDHADTAGPSGATAAAVTVPRPDGPGYVLVAVTDSSTAVRLSPGIDVDPASGSADRTFADVPDKGGAAITTVDRSSDAAVQLQLVGPGLAVQLRPTSADHRDTLPGAQAPPVPSRSGADTASAAVVGAAVDTVTSATGWAAQDLDVSVLGAGVVGEVDGHPAEVAAVAAVLPDGGIVTTTVVVASWTGADGSVSTSWTYCGSSALPAGADPATLVVAATCSVEVTTGTAERVAVVAAPPGHRVQLDFADGGAPVDAVLTDGFGIVPDLPARGLATATDGVAVVPVAGPGRDALTG